MKKSKRQLSRKSMLYIFIGIVLIFVMTLIGGGVFLRVLDIDVEGSYRYTAEEIIEASGLSIGNNLLFLNARSIEQNIRESKPFVNNVTVTGIPPYRVLIEIDESTAIARVSMPNEILIIDSTGRVLDSLSSGVHDVQSNIAVAGLIEVRGVDPENPVAGSVLRSSRLDAETRIQSMQEVLESLEREGLESNITYIDVSNITNIHIGYLSMYRIVFGGLSNVRSNMGRLEAAIEEVMISHPNVSGEINMTDPTGRPGFIPNVRDVPTNHNN